VYSISRRILAALAACGLATATSMAAPQTCTTHSDRFDELIPQFGAKAVAWAKQQTDLTRAKLEASPNFTAVMADMRAVHANGRPLPSYDLLAGRRYMRIERDESHPYGRIEAADAKPDGLPGAWRTAFDLDAYNKTAPTHYTIKWINPEAECLAPAYERCMLSLYYKGGQDNAYVELDLTTGTLVKDGFRLEPGRNSLAWLDRDTLLVAHTTQGAPALPNQFPAELHVWKRGTPLAQAPVIYRADPKDSLFEFALTGQPGKRRIFLNVSKTYTEFQLEELTIDGRTTDLPLPHELADFGTPRFSQGRLAVQLAGAATLQNHQYPADTIVAYDLESHHVSAVMMPPPDVYLSGGFTATRSGFAIIGVRNLQRILYLATPAAEGWTITQRLLEEPGVTLRAASDDQSDALLLREEGLMTPPRYRLLTGVTAPAVVDSARSQTDLHDYTVEIKSARSKDGVPIDYYFMHKLGRRSAPTPTILQGYGGFGISDDPAYFCCRFGAAWKSWFDRGGAFAVAAIRGGGERGAGWHLAATGHHKIRSFEDFDAVAEALERSGFTDAAHLGVTGHSEGGELAAVVVVMRPDLYAAAVIGAPTTDNSIIGKGDGGISAGMAAEEGDWDVPADRRFMRIWDPYSNIRAGVTYPKTLSVVATTDNQVGPSHARRFVAKMQEVCAPALLLEGSEGGHDYPDEYTQTADTAMQMSFFIDTLVHR
jgi:prolyl oligopeptidase